MATEMEVVKGIFEDIAQLVDEQSDAVGMRSSTCMRGVAAACGRVRSLACAEEISLNVELAHARVRHGLTELEKAEAFQKKG